MIIKRILIKNRLVFRRVRYRRNDYLCGQVHCIYRCGSVSSGHPICDLCSNIREKFCMPVTLDLSAKDSITRLLYVPSEKENS